MEPVQASLEALSRYFVGDTTMGDTLDRVCRAALDAIEPAHYCGITMSVDGKVGTYVFSHPEMPEIDRSQYEAADGPCVRAFTTGEVVLVRRTDEPGPFEHFRRVAAAHGVRSVMSMPMRAAGQTVGALNFYAHAADAFDDASTRLATSFAEQAAFLLVNAQAYWDARTLSENLRQAMTSRAVIEQAKGIIMATTGVSPEEAFERLRMQSQHENVKVRELAEEIVQRASRRDRPR